MRLTNCSRVLILGVILSYCVMAAGGMKLPFLLIASVTSGLMVAVVFSRRAECLFFGKASTKANHKLATFTFGLVLLFGVFGFATVGDPLLLAR